MAIALVINPFCTDISGQMSCANSHEAGDTEYAIRKAVRKPSQERDVTGLSRTVG